MIRSGWEITATWPVRTERAGRTRDIGANALASSIVLACRPRDDAATATTRRAFLGALKAELPSALKDLQQVSVAPVDLAQAAIGPGMAVFSRYAKVVEADGSDMTVRTALALINHTLDEVLSEQEGDFDADTLFCLKWFRQFEWNEATAGQADVLARATNTSIDGLGWAGVFRAVAGKARLLAPTDLKDGWDPLTDDRISLWEVVLPAVAEQQDMLDSSPGDTESDPGRDQDGTDDGGKPSPQPEPSNRRYFGTYPVDPERYGRDLTRLSQEILQPLTSVDGARVRISVEIHAEREEGFPEDKVRIIQENARTLRFEQSSFEDR